MKVHLIAVAVSLAAAGPAHADYSVQVNATTCARFARLAPALAAANSITPPQVFVRGTNTESSATLIPITVILTGASAPCTAGAQGTIQLAAGTPTRVLEVASDVILTLQGVTVIGGDVAGATDQTGSGGTIYLDDNSVLLMQRASIVRDGVAALRGGCIFVDHAQIIMDPGTTVTNCHATDGGGVGIVGTGDDGGYDVLHNLVTNVAAGSGGGTWIDSAPVCLFEATTNAAALDGGAAYVTSTFDTAWLGTYTTQTSNTATRDGGSVFATGALTTLDAASQMSTNHAIGNGGGIRLTGATTAYLDPGSMLMSNTAQGDGGGLHGDGASQIFVARVFDTGQIPTGEGHTAPCGTPSGAITIDSNKAGFDAGGNPTSTTRDGGGVYLANAAITKDDATSQFAISNNRAVDDGGGVAAYAAASVTFDHVDVTGNRANHGNGGGLLANATGSLSLAHTTFTSNAAVLGGGGGVALVATTDAAKATLDQVTFTTNIAIAGGGLGLNTNAKATVTRSLLTSNLAVTGGGIYSGNGSALTMPSGAIASNTASIGGGVVADAAAVTLGDASCASGLPCIAITGNTATGGVARGGAIVLASEGASVQVSRSIIYANTADSGGALWMDRATQSLSVVNSAVVSNVNPAGSEPGIFAQAGTLSLVNATIAHNNQGIILGPATVTMNDSLVIQNGLDIGFGTGSVAGSCNAVNSAVTAAAIVGTLNVATTSTNASVDGVTGAPINTAEIVDTCTAVQTIDILGLPRPSGVSADRGAYELKVL